jgi:hypothetical protein
LKTGEHQHSPKKGISHAILARCPRFAIWEFGSFGYGCDIESQIAFTGGLAFGSAGNKNRAASNHESQSRQAARTIGNISRKCT